MTNADKIRSMSDEELAEWLDDVDDQGYFCEVHCPYFKHFTCTETSTVVDCRKGRLLWLRQEYKEVRND